MPLEYQFAPGSHDNMPMEYNYVPSSHSNMSPDYNYVPSSHNNNNFGDSSYLPKEYLNRPSYANVDYFNSTAYFNKDLKKADIAPKSNMPDIYKKMNMPKEYWNKDPFSESAQNVDSKDQIKTTTADDQIDS